MNKHLLQSEVPSWADLTAQIATKRAARSLKLPVPNIQWIKTNLYERRAGWVNQDIRNTIFLSLKWARDNGVKQLQGLIYHEVRHLWQTRHCYLTELDERRKAENDANKFVFEKLGILLHLEMWWEHDY